MAQVRWLAPIPDYWNGWPRMYWRVATRKGGLRSFGMAKPESVLPKSCSPTLTVNEARNACPAKNGTTRERSRQWQGHGVALKLSAGLLTSNERSRAYPLHRTSEGSGRASGRISRALRRTAPAGDAVGGGVTCSRIRQGGSDRGLRG